MNKLGQWLGKLLGQEGKQPLGEGERKLLSNLLVVGLVGLVMLLSLGFFSKEAPRKEAPKTSEPKQESLSQSQLLETELATMLSKIRGAGQVRVAITFAGTGKREYATNKKETVKVTQEDVSDGGKRTVEESTTEEQKILAKGDGMREEALIQQELAPEVLGVLIVAQGAADDLVAEKLTRAAGTFLGIGTNRIVVMEGK